MPLPHWLLGVLRVATGAKLFEIGKGFYFSIYSTMLHEIIFNIIFNCCFMKILPYYLNLGQKLPSKLLHNYLKNK